MEDVTLTFDYSNAPVRPPGRVLRALGAVVPRINRVRAQAEPYAEAWGRDNRAALAGVGPVWVSLGDSMAQSVGASGHRRGFVGQLSDRLQLEWPHRLVNLSVFGARIQDGLEAQVPELESLVSQDVPVALVTVVLGSNDIVAPNVRRGMVERFTALVDALPPGAVVSNLPNPHREARQIDKLLQRREQEGSLLLADMRRRGPRDWSGLLAEDWFHPNDKGYAVMADVLERPVREALDLPAAGWDVVGKDKRLKRRH